MIIRGVPRCDGIDKRQDAWGCASAVVRRVSYRFPKSDGSTGTMTLHACQRHLAQFLDEADRAVGAFRGRLPEWPAPEVVPVEHVRTGSDRAHGRPGVFVEADAGPVQLRLL